MIAITDLHDNVKYVNAELIEFIEQTPDTQIILNNGHRFYAKESPEEVVKRIIAYRRQCLGGMQGLTDKP